MPRLSDNGSLSNASPADSLIGKRLQNGWTVESVVERPDNATGGHFSVSYIVRSETGSRAFLKAMDYRKALESEDPARFLFHMTAAFQFERVLLEKCLSHRMSRIVRVLDDGTIPAHPGDPSTVVQYLIFELAEGDIRSFAEFGDAFDNAWALRTMHQATAALRQLHAARVAHQDLKPSNVLVFEQDLHKLADVGRAYDHNRSSPHDGMPCAGDASYAPPELLYGYVHRDWRVRRLACDLYLLGSLLVFLYTGTSITHMIFSRLDPRYHYSNWHGEYIDVLPYVEHTFAQLMRDLGPQIPGDCSRDIVMVVEHLCSLDPDTRGHPKNLLSGVDRYSLERYVSLFDRLAKRALWTRTKSE